MQDDWGSPTAQYHTHTRDASMRDGDLEVPGMVGDSLEGDMAIPEPTPYTEPEPYYEEEDLESSHEEVRTPFFGAARVRIHSSMEG